MWSVNRREDDDMTLTIQDVLFTMSTAQGIDVLGKSLGDVSVADLMIALQKSGVGPLGKSPITFNSPLSIPQIDIPDEEE